MKKTSIGYGDAPTLPFILSSNFAEFNRPSPPSPPPFNRRGRHRGRRAPPYPTADRALHSFLKMRPEDDPDHRRCAAPNAAGGESEGERARPGQRVPLPRGSRQVALKSNGALLFGCRVSEAAPADGRTEREG